jgi:hypothetical protein
MAGQRIELPQFSMFAQTPVYDVGDDIVFGLMKDVVVPDATDTQYIVDTTGVNRLDLISYRFYGTSMLWWVIARVNNMLDPLVGPTLKQTLRIPTKSRLASLGVLNV